MMTTVEKPSNIRLRDYQHAAITSIKEHIAGGARRLVLSIPTGGGKTLIFSSLSDALGLAPTERILILAHRDELVNQAVEKYLGICPAEFIGLEKAENRVGPMHRVCVASVQTLKGVRLEEFVERWGTPKLIITDECHHAPAPNYMAIYERFGVTPTGDILHIGVTATPRRADNVGLDAVYDVIAYSIGIGELVERGYLVPLMGYRVQTGINLDAVHTVAGDFNQKELGATVNTPERNARVVQAYTDITPGRKALVFSASVQHSMDLCEMFRIAGFSAAHVDGETPVDERRQILRDFHDGQYDLLCNCAVFTEGYDEPTLEVVMIAGPTKSSVKYAQMVGRATRLSAGKTKAAVIDIVDATRKHSVITLPTLLGLPANFNLGGRNATALASRHAEMLEDNPLVGSLIHDAAMLERLERIPTAERMGALVQRYLDQAKETQTYVDVDLFQPPLIPEDMGAEMLWISAGDDTYRLKLKGETVIITPTMVGYDVVVKSKSQAQHKLGSFRGYRDAFTTAELWVRERRGDQLHLLDAKAEWRTQEMTSKQRAMLKQFRVKTPPGMTKGEAAMAIDTIMEGVARGTRHVPSK
jgi:superfamily II DNA or RNA helicase